jgi:D-alanyl-lipoteichoic acid acyltransferase DltB (MBOAT superfamily)
MLFISAKFFVLLAATLLACSVVRPERRPLVLLAASYAFYGLWSAPYLLLLVAATLVAYGTARLLDDARTDTRRRNALFAGLLILLGTLAAFKYAGLLASLALGAGSPHAASVFSRIVMPLGISYYTFKLISYVVDVYWGKMEAERNLIAFALYPAFFPQILSGPIQRAEDFLAQIKRPVVNDPDVIKSGLRLMLFGYFKMRVVAELLAAIVNPTFAEPHLYSSWAVLLASYAFVFQLYADFSGLTDIAIGTGRILGIESPPNFDMPFTAPNIQALWRRWHMTLTRWLADYVFLPLRMALRSWGAFGIAVAITVNFVAIGLWHAATWTFLAFGLLHALYMCVSVFTLTRRDAFFARHPALALGRRVWAPLVTFQLWAVSEILFRADSLSHAGTVIGSILAFQTSGSGVPGSLALALSAVAIMETVHWLQARHQGLRILQAMPVVPRWCLYYACLFAIMFFDNRGATGFIYVKF